MTKKEEIFANLSPFFFKQVMITSYIERKKSEREREIQLTGNFNNVYLYRLWFLLTDDVKMKIDKN